MILHPTRLIELLLQVNNLIFKISISAVMSINVPIQLKTSLIWLQFYRISLDSANIGQATIHKIGLFNLRYLVVKKGMYTS